MIINISAQERNHRAIMALCALFLFATLFFIYTKGKAQQIITDTIAVNMIERQAMIDEALEL